MFKGTTPTYAFTLPAEANISQASHVYATFSDAEGRPVITKTGNALEIEDDTVGVFLTQKETLILPAGTVKVQLNWLYQDGGTTKRACSKIKTIQAENNLLNKELPQ